MFKFASKIKNLFNLVLFIARNPRVTIIGGPILIAFLGKRHRHSLSGFYSQAGQDAYLLTEYFHEIDKLEFPKVFLDVGCNHPVKHNNSYYFERHMGFKVIGIDALEKYESEWKKIRPNADMIVTAVGKEDGVLEFEETEHDGHEGDMYSAVKGQSKKARKLNRVSRMVPVTTLTRILKSRGINDVGIMSLDIEGYEINALQGLDTESIKIRIVILENNSNNQSGSEVVRLIMNSKGYVLKARIWGLDDIYEHVSLNSKLASK